MDNAPIAAASTPSSPMERVREAERAKASVVFVPASTTRKDFEACVRAIKAKMSAFTRGPLFLYTPHGEGAERLAQVRELANEVSSFDLPPEAAYLMRTSGSTSGTGKIVMLSTAALVASAKATEAALGGPSRWITCLPSAHVAGFQTIFRSLLAGRTPLWGGRGRYEEISDALAGFAGSEPVRISLVPRQLARLLESDDGGALLARFDAVLVGGAALEASLAEQARAAGIRLVVTYGMTETCGGCVYDGVPIGGAEIEVAPDGRITLSGPMVALGYAGSEPFEGRFVTADAGKLAREVDTGRERLDVLGRIDGAVTTGGVTVIPEVVEAEMERAGFGASIVVGVPDATWGQALVALTTREEPKAREALKARLETGWMPSRIVTVSELGLSDLPMLESGKPDRARTAEILTAAL